MSNGTTSAGLYYGGNKPRKLEFLLGDALARGARTVITFGALGSNHALATAICGRRLGLRVVLILVPQPLSDAARHNLLLAHAQGEIEPRHTVVWQQYLGQGYAHPSREGHEAVRLMHEREGIHLDEEYTGKTLAALIDASADPAFKERRVLFWNTFNSLSLEDLLPQGYDYHCLPENFHRIFEVK